MKLKEILNIVNEDRKPYPQFKVGDYIQYKLKKTGIYQRPFSVVSTNDGIRVKSLSNGRMLNTPINPDEWEITTFRK